MPILSRRLSSRSSIAIASASSLFIVRPHEKAVGPVLDDLGNPLPSTTDHRLSDGHGLEINAAQTFIAAGQSEYRTSAHGVCDLAARLAAGKAHAIAHVEFVCESGKPDISGPSPMISSVRLGNSDDSAANARMSVA